ncbi:MAG: 2-C-methyl-D-erythritol 4-phosphate cytidylyltransferase [Acidobacteria bacterium]|nr:2-C-methyl-D-erythritol 4-phosphate cytidylyltransferase [Acidobacteriota bacterium]
MRVYLVIAAGGKGLRMGGGVPKQFRDWNGRPLLKATIEAFFGEGMPSISGLALAVPENRIAEVRAWPFPAPSFVVKGGETRQASVAAALAALPDDHEAAVLIHDGVRPFPPSGPIREALAALREWDGAVLAEPSTDTLKRVGRDLRILSTEPREEFYRAQTPQVARLGLWRDAFASADRDGFTGTDDVQLLERLGWRVKVIPAPGSNLKITNPEDWARL